MQCKGLINDESEAQEGRGAWVAQSVERPTLALVMISRSVSRSPTSGSVRTAQSLEPASDKKVMKLILITSQLCV